MGAPDQGVFCMNLAALVVFLANLVLIALLPRIFFRRDGRFNFMWFVTAAPFAISGAGLSLCAVGRAAPWHAQFDMLRTAMEVAGSAFAVVSFGLIAFALGTHRIPISLWHQDNDAPQHIVTWGAYERIRHPFYASFLLVLFAIAIASPHATTVLAWVYAFVILNYTAAREERQLASSQYGKEYRTYMARSGRFLPYLGRIHHD